jgi:ATP-dependent RNA helicase SUPV3L1/SUV3
MQKVRSEMDGADFVRQKAATQSFSQIWNNFKMSIDQSVRHGGKGNLSRDLAEAYKHNKMDNMETYIRRAFYNHLFDGQFSEADVANQKKVADLRFPSEWYPRTRTMTRKVFLHVGPTNSGKTYQALQRLEQAESGVYAGPLRLLAHEVYSRMNAKGKKCLLLTGEEKRKPPDEGAESTDKMSDFNLISCTVEMFPTQRLVDVAVIDEIQMIGHEDRGWAWTQAFLGVRAEEVHLCGEERTVPMIEEICALIGDELVVNRYKRLSGLEMAPESLNGDLTKLRKGDCIVSFSVMGIHALKKQIEKATRKNVAIVYGSLPPETRAQQARLFNEPDNNFDFLVASDAIGMGLNLAIKRVIFESSAKFNGRTLRTLSVADTRQIGGRAGRFRTSIQVNETPVDPATVHAQAESAAASLTEGKAVAETSNLDVETPTNIALPVRKDESVGIVTTLDAVDYPIIKKNMASEPLPIVSAGILPPSHIVERFASYFPPRTPFSYMMTRLHELSQMHRRFHLCELKDVLWIADLIEPVEGLSVVERLTMCSVPASKTDVHLWKELLPALARVAGSQRAVTPADIEEMPLEVLEAPDHTDGREYLRDLERLHKGLVAYLWLGYRFSGVFLGRPMAIHAKELVEGRIERVLSKIKIDEAKRLAKKNERARAVAEAEAIEAAMRAAEVEDLVGPEPSFEGSATEIDSDAGTENSQIVSASDATGGNEPLGLAEEDLAEKIVKTSPKSEDADETAQPRVSSGSV